MTTTFARFPAGHGPPPPIPGAGPAPLSPAELEEALRSFQRLVLRPASVPPAHVRGHGSRQRQFQGWVANRLAYQRVVPRKDAAILSNCPDPDVRREWIQRIIDHDGTAPGTGGIELWIRLGDGARRAARGDGGRAPRAAGGAAHLRVVRHLLPDQAVESRRARRRSPSCSRPRSISSGSRRFRSTTRGSRPTALDYFKSRLVQAPRDVKHGLSHRPAHCTTVRDAAPGVRGARASSSRCCGR